MTEITGVGTLVELKDAFKEHMTQLNEGLSNGVKVEGANVVVSQENADEIKRIHGEAMEIKSYIDMFGMIANGEQVYGNGVDTKAVRDSIALNDAVKSLVMDGRTPSLGQAFVMSNEFKEFKTSKADSMRGAYELQVFDLASMGRKDVYAAMDPGTITRTFGQIQFDPIVPRGQRRTRVRDLFPVATTSANLIDFFQVIGFVENNTATGNTNPAVTGGSGNAGPVPDYVPGSPGNFGLKPKSNLQFKSNQAPVRTLAHWEAAHRNVIDDEPQLQATINNELLYGLQLEEDYQILKGTGTNEDLLGILNTPGIQTYTPASGEIHSDTLRRAATLSILANYPSTGYVLHPNDWEKLELQKGSTTGGGGDGQYMIVTNVAIGAQAQIWRQPVVETPVMAAGNFLTGAFGTGAQLYDRQQANVRIADQHADFFVRNAIVILAEERLALAVKRPESFIAGTFAA